MRTLFADLRYAFRVMSRTPSFAVAVVSVLALGIGANTTIFSIVNAVLLRPLPFEEPERLVRIFTRTPGGRLFELSPGKFYDWQRDAQSFEGMAMYQCCGFRELALTGTGTARTVRATAVSAGFFEIVRARPALGRVFRQEEDTPGGKHVVVLSDRFWRTEFGGHPDVIGRTVKLNDEAYTIVGVMPATASVASWTGMASDVWIPLALTDEQRADRGNHNRDGVARLKQRCRHWPRRKPRWTRSPHGSRVSSRNQTTGGESWSSRCRRKSSAIAARCCSCCSAPSGWSSSSPAPTSVTCCSLAP